MNNSPMTREAILENTGIDIHDYVVSRDMLDGLRMGEYLYQFVIVGTLNGKISLHDTDFCTGFDNVAFDMRQVASKYLGKKVADLQMPVLNTDHQFVDEMDLTDLKPVDHPLMVHYENRWDGRPKPYSIELLDCRMKAKEQGVWVNCSYAKKLKKFECYDTLTIHIMPFIDPTFATRKQKHDEHQRKSFKRIKAVLHKITGVSTKGFDPEPLECLDTSLRRRCFNPAHSKDPVLEAPTLLHHLEEYLDCWREMAPDFCLPKKKK